MSGGEWTFTIAVAAVLAVVFLVSYRFLGSGYTKKEPMKVPAAPEVKKAPLKVAGPYSKYV
jgi:hypothetical protein